MQGKKRSKVEHLRAFLTRQAGIFRQKHRRKADCQQTLRLAAFRFAAPYPAGSHARQKEKQ
ncbi:hypothetical protein [Neisseria bacilliformis]|uniref:hypothetical protein n=1 Tax=Neisseria bacilliformis TaxID=267212 RepID=UPI003C751B29